MATGRGGRTSEDGRDDGTGQYVSSGRVHLQGQALERQLLQTTVVLQQRLVGYASRPVLELPIPLVGPCPPQ